MTTAEFLVACTSFARRHPAAVIEMTAPELAVDPRARARHTASTILAARRRMQTTAKLAMRERFLPPSELFQHSGDPA